MPISPGDPVYSLRRQLAKEIVRSLGPKAQHNIAPSYGIPQPRMSELGRGLVDRCSVEWLIRRVYRLGGTVSLTITLGDTQGEWTRRRLGRMRAGIPGRTPRSASAASDEPAFGDGPSPIPRSAIPRSPIPCSAIPVRAIPHSDPLRKTPLIPDLE